MALGNLEQQRTTARPVGAARSRQINYRYPAERWMLLVTLIVIGLAIYFLQGLSAGGLIFIFIVGPVLNYLFIRATIEGFKRDSVQVSETQFPEIKALVDECRDYVAIPADTRVFISYSPYLNAFAIGLGRPYSIVLFSALIDHLDRDELKYVLSHEMGHIKFKHTVWLTLIGQLGAESYGLPLLGWFYRFCFLLWSRTAELSADRAGLVGCGRLDKAISAQLKAGAGPWLAERVDIKTLARQAHETQGNFWAAFCEAWGSHPLMTTRIQRMVNFAASETFRLLRPDASFTSTTEAAPASSTPSGWSEEPAPTSESPTRPSNGLDELIAAAMPPADPAAADEVAPVDWTTELNFQRLYTAAIRANTDQADMWLRLGELLQTHGEEQQAAICLQQARSLIAPSTAQPTVSSGQLATQLDSLVLAVGQKQWPPSKLKGKAACPTCGGLNPPGAHYCHQCQTQLQKPCLRCGAWLSANYRNCPNCGQQQAQLIAALKAEADSTRKTGEYPLPPRRLTRWELIYGSIFLIDVILVLVTLAWRVSAASLAQAAPYFASAFLVPILGVIIGLIWARRRRRRYWRIFDEVDAAIRRYNDIAHTLSQHNIILDPPRLPLNDPWR